MPGKSIGSVFIELQARTSRFNSAMLRSSASLTRVGKSAVKLGGILTKFLVTAFAAVASASVVQFAKFDQQMTKSTAIIRDMNADLRKQMELTARSLSRESITPVEELAEAYFFLASAGLSAKQSMGALDLVNKFAIAGAFDMATATDLLTDSQSALGLTVADTAKNMENMRRISDVLIKANTLSNATARQFAESLTNKAAAALRRFNKDAEEGVAVLAAFAEQGTKGLRAGERLNILLRELERTARENSDAWEKMSLSVFGADGNMRNLADIIEGLERRLKPMSDIKKGATLALLGFTSESMDAIVQLIGMSEKIRGYEKELRNAAGTTEDVANKQMKSFANQMQVVWNIIKDVALVIGQDLTPILSVFVAKFKDGSDATEGFARNAQFLSDIMRTGLLVSIGVVLDTLAGFKVVLKVLEIAALGLGTLFVFVLERMQRGLELMISKATGTINDLIIAVNRAAGTDFDTFTFKGFDDTAIKNSLDTMIKSTEMAKKELIELMKEGVLPSEKMIQRVIDKEKEMMETLQDLFFKARVNLGGTGDEMEKLAEVSADVTSSIKNNWSDTFDSIAKDLARGEFRMRSFLDFVADEFFAFLFPKGLLGSIFGKSSTGNLFGDIFKGFSKKQAGGPVSAGSFNLVGETGTEAFIPSVNGTILPHRALAMAGGGGPTIVIEQHNTFGDGVQGATRAEILRAMPAIKDSVIGALIDEVQRRTPIGRAIRG